MLLSFVYRYTMLCAWFIVFFSEKSHCLSGIVPNILYHSLISTCICYLLPINNYDRIDSYSSFYNNKDEYNDIQL